MDKQTLRFRKHETFYIREGWLQKAINAIPEHNDLFSKNKGQKILGIGTNMVKGLRYWLQACNIINRESIKTEFSDFGKLLHEYDKYLETNFSMFLIHYYLTENISYNPIGHVMFNMNLNTFTKQDASDAILIDLQQKGYEVKKEYVDTDLGIFLNSYYEENRNGNPEDNYICPLSSLKLLKKQNEKYIKNKPHYKDLSYLVVYNALCHIYKNENSFNISDSINEPKSPCKIFNLDKSMYLQYLEEMKNDKLITINKTAGLNSVYFEQKYTLEQIFEKYFRGHKNV